MSNLKLDDYEELIRDELRCECGKELHYEDDESLSRCMSCDPDRETKTGFKNE